MSIHCRKAVSFTIDLTLAITGTLRFEKPITASGLISGDFSNAERLLRNGLKQLKTSLVWAYRLVNIYLEVFSDRNSQ